MSSGDEPPSRLAVAWGFACVVGVLAHGAHYSFLCDDAYISFRYVRNLVEGRGLVFNPGEYVEGYSNFLWVLQLAAIWSTTGVGPEWAAWSLGWASTLATLALVFRLAWKTPLPGRNAAVALVGLFLATNRSFAVWCTSGLETRQNTAIVLLALSLLHAARWRDRWLLLAGAAFGLAALSRPEGVLFGACGGVWLALEGARCGNPVGKLVRSVALLAAPQALVAAAHVAFRFWYYGALVPNTYTAKGDPWMEGGAMYLAGAAVEYGFLIVVPLACVGAWARWRRGDSLHVLGAVVAIPHLLSVASVGGDHFEYRMFDLAFPLLFLAATDGILRVVSWVPARARALATGAIAVGILPYLTVISWMDDTATRGWVDGGPRYSLHVDVTGEHGGWLWNLPGIARSAGVYNQIRQWESRRLIASRWLEHYLFWRARLRQYGSYEDRDLRDGLVMVEGTMGVMPFYLDEVTFIDAFGLTDATVARMPRREPAPGEFRRLAHPIKNMMRYARERGQNIAIRPHETKLEACTSSYALWLGPGSWMPFDTESPDVLSGARILALRPTGGDIERSKPLVVDGELYAVDRVLWDFDSIPEGWQSSGDAFRRMSRGPHGGQSPISGFLGKAFANSYTAKHGDRAKGRLVSPPFEVEPGTHLGFLIGGGREGVGVRVHGPDGLVATRTGLESERLRLVVVPLEAHAGPFSIEVFDDAEGPWAHVLADQFVLLREIEPPSWLVTR